MNSFFSKKSVNDLVPSILRPIEMLCKRLEEASRVGETLNMKYFYAAVTLDVMNAYCFARETESVLRPDFNRQFFDDVDGFVEVSLLVNI